jgi:hypothetical protein
MRHYTQTDFSFEGLLSCTCIVARDWGGGRAVPPKLWKLLREWQEPAISYDRLQKLIAASTLALLPNK